MLWPHSSWPSALAVGGAALALGATLLAAAPAAAGAGQDPAPGVVIAPPAATGAGPATFTIFLRSVPIGSEQTSVERTATGWTITSSSRMGAPVDVVGRTIQARYTDDWNPVDLTIDATVQNQLVTDRTTVTGGTASSAFAQGGQSQNLTATVAPGAIFLPAPFWGQFESLAQRLKTAAAGSKVVAFQPRSPASIELEVGESSEETIQTASRIVHARRTLVKMPVSGRPALDLEVWGDESGRLVRVSVPAQNLDIVREDIASVAARRVVVSRAGDEQVRIPANGFTLAATVSKPAAGDDKPQPAVILVGGSGPTDRDETVFGIPVFGQLANALADAGFLVVRYDKRGVGQSGGRPEAATLADFADDLRAVVKTTSERKDVDKKRIVVIGHSEGGAVAMLAAANENRIAALVLVAAIGVTGADLNMYQVTHAIERANRPAAERENTLALQKKIQTAVLTGVGWESIPATLRQQAETPWFQSFLAFDPAKLMSDIDQPMLVVQGELDTQVPPSNGDTLLALARGRKKAARADLVKVPGVNHLLVPATTGEFDEYASLKDQKISPTIPAAISDWLKSAVPAARP